MPTVTVSCGSDGRDFSTMTLAEDDAANQTGNDFIVDCFNDSAFDEVVTINDSTPDSITFTVNSTAERHDGTAGTGVRIVQSANQTSQINVSSTVAMAVEWIECDGNGFRQTSEFMCRATGDTANVITFANMIIHDGDIGGNSDCVGILSSANRANDVTNCFLYDFKSPGSGNSRAINALSTSRTKRHLNNTIHNVTNSDSGSAFGMGFSDNASVTVQNLICTGSDDGDYEVSAPSNATVDHNVSEDTTSSGTGSIDSITTASTFVSTAVGSEDLHLISGASVIDSGVDLGTTPSGVNFDIDNRDRDAQGDVWDIGADEFVSVVPPSSGLVSMMVSKILEI